ncbi:Uma2 family endonuclease [Symmachiella dynata]|uniref:Uma2 family endonuclease n=1 Tax=Symmachiella dynata TaxID=2527995 RepID=UPI0030EDEEAE
MATATPAHTTTFPEDWTVADLQKHLGGIPAERIRISPPPGQATEADLIRTNDRKQGICELIDHVLVEKPMGYFESQLAFLIGFFLHSYLTENNLGIVLGEAGPVLVRDDQVRIPDVSFIAWDRLPDRKLPQQAILPVAPDLAIEVLSPGNTKAEMDRKLRDYFNAGTQLVWYLDPKARQMRVYTSVDDVETIDESGTVSGGDVLPGFSMSLQELFERADREAPEQS